jgi:hypothetical protein
VNMFGLTTLARIKTDPSLLERMITKAQRSAFPLSAENGHLVRMT